MEPEVQPGVQHRAPGWRPGITVIRPIREGDAELLAATMRQADRAEVLAARGFSPAQAVSYSIAASCLSATLELAGEVAAIFGLCTAEAVPGSAQRISPFWLLSGEAANRHPIAYFKGLKRIVGSLVESSGLIGCVVDGRYAAALRAAALLGAEVHAPHSHGDAGLPFHLVTWRAPWA